MENSGSGNHIGRDAALAHFSLMFGYKIFSLYYPLFLAAGGLSLAQIGKVYFLIYLPMALGAPLAGFLTRLVHPALMAAVACLGYGAYALAMAFDAQNAVAINYAGQSPDVFRRSASLRDRKSLFPRHSSPGQSPEVFWRVNKKIRRRNSDFHPLAPRKIFLNISPYSIQNDFSSSKTINLPLKLFAVFI